MNYFFKYLLARKTYTKESEFVRAVKFEKTTVACLVGLGIRTVPTCAKTYD